MTRHKLLRTVTIVGALIVAAGIALRDTRFSAQTHRLAVVGPFLSSFWRSMRLHAEHLTSAQLLQAAAGAWLIFVLLLVLLARTRTTEPSSSEAHIDPATGATPPETQPARSAPLRQAAEQVLMQPLPARSAPADDASPTYDISDDAMAARLEAGALSPTVSGLVATSGIGSESQPDQEDGSNRVGVLQPTLGHTVALSGVIEARDRLLSYGLFVVAEDARIPYGASGASQRTVSAIIERVAPVLTGNVSLEREQCAYLLNLAVLHANLDLRAERVRTSVELEVAVTAALVIDNVAQVVSSGCCHSYLFRESSGLTQIPVHQLAMAGLDDVRRVESLDQAMHLTCDQPELVGTHRSASQPPSHVDSGEVLTQPDDLLLLTSPKLWQALRRPQVEAILHGASSAHTAARSLAGEAASQPGGQDFGVIVIRPRVGRLPGFGIAVARPAAV